MRCAEVIRELAVPSPGRDDVALAQHLAECETCARWANRAAKLDRLWEATRPAEPTPETWDGLWAAMAARLDQPTMPAERLARLSHRSEPGSQVLPFPGPVPATDRVRRWRSLAAIGLVGLVQAAALVLAISLSWRAPVPLPRGPLPPESPQVAQNTAPLLNSEVDVEEGQVVLIRSEGSKVEVIDLTAQETPNSVDRWYLVYNEFESMANPVLAMTE